MHRINNSLAEEGQPVMVYQELSDEDNGGILCAEQILVRRGYAVSADAGEYMVRFTDGLDPHVGDGGPVGGGSWHVFVRVCFLVSSDVSSFCHKESCNTENPTRA